MQSSSSAPFRNTGWLPRMLHRIVDSVFRTAFITALWLGAKLAVWIDFFDIVHDFEKQMQGLFVGRPVIQKQVLCRFCC
jgi:hypothetical protein